MSLNKIPCFPDRAGCHVFASEECNSSLFDAPWWYNSKIQDIESRVTEWSADAGVPIAVTSRLRNCEEQLALYKAGKTRVRPGTSQHEWGFAFDVVPNVAALRAHGATFRQGLEWLGQVAIAYGGVPVVEGDHTHVQLFSAATWRAWLVASGIIASLPIPRRGAGVPPR